MSVFETRKQKEAVRLSIHNDGHLHTEGTHIKDTSSTPAVNWRYLYLFGGIGTSIVVPIVLGMFVGKYFDGQWNTKPTATLVGLSIGFIISLVHVGTTIQTFLRDQKR